ncbi:MAG TPA: sulfite exporter TauE/SafE family protein [Burkholderiales bacterium]
MDVLLLVLIGAVAGMLAGLFGIGGGVVIVPVLAFVFENQGVAGDALMHCAIGTSLATIAFTAMSSVRAHHARGSIRWPVFRQLAPGIVVGALAGARVAHALASETLEVLFGFFLLFVAFQMVRPPPAAAQRQPPALGWMLLAGLGIGALSSLFGIGGGAISVPFLAWCGLTPVQAVATAAAIGLPIALAGTAGYIVTGLQAPALPPWSLGYVVLPAFAGIVAASMLFAPLGARLAHRLKPLVLRRAFGTLLALFGVRMLLD